MAGALMTLTLGRPLALDLTQHPAGAFEDVTERPGLSPTASAAPRLGRPGDTFTSGDVDVTATSTSLSAKPGRS